MPYKALEDPDRRKLTLRALSGENAQKLADEYHVSRSHVYKLKEEATKNADSEGEFWDGVRSVIRRKQT